MIELTSEGIRVLDIIAYFEVLLLLVLLSLLLIGLLLQESVESIREASGS